MTWTRTSPATRPEFALALFLALAACGGGDPPEGLLQPCSTVEDCPDEEMVCARIPMPPAGLSDARCTYLCDPDLPEDDEQCPLVTCTLEDDPVLCEQLIGDFPHSNCYDDAAIALTAEPTAACGP